MPARKFRYLPHTADAKFIGYGKSFAEALENAALALLNVRFAINTLKKDPGKIKSLAIKEKADTRENAAWYILQRMLSKIDAYSLAAFKFKVIGVKESKSGAFEISGRLFFKKTKKDYTLTDVKAVTPHEFEVKHNLSWKIKVVVDI